MCGFQTVILEADAALGGLCRAWERDAYVFDGCLRWLVGTHPPSKFHEMWQELGVIAALETELHDEIVRIESPAGETLTVPADLSCLAAELKRLAPADTARIDRLVRDARRCAPIEPIDRPLELMTPWEKLRTGWRYLPFLPTVAKWKRLSTADYLATYRSPLLREALKALVGDERVSALALVMLLAFRSRRNTGSVRGGSRALTRALVERYARLGGEVRLNTRVTAIVAEEGCAKGVRCAGERWLPANAVISCADGHATIFELLEGRFLDRRILRAYQRGELFPPLIQVSLGVGREFPDAPRTLILLLPQPLIVDAHTRQDRLETSVFAANSGFCPPGKTVVTVRFTGHCESWISLNRHAPDRYQAQKQRLVRDVVAVLDRRFPGLARHVEVSDVATPATFVRHTGNWRGSYEGWLPTPRVLGRWLPFTLPRLRGFYMAGHWVAPGGGLPLAALSSRYVAQLLCADYGREFTPGKSGWKRGSDNRQWSGERADWPGRW
jgi:phytoene dehydrogenase-like protein